MKASLVRPALVALAVSAVVGLALGASAAACPFCDSGPAGRGNEVRQAILGDGFLANVLTALAPFAVVLAIVALLLRTPRRPATGPDSHPLQGPIG